MFSQDLLQGKAGIVTGGSSGIGLAIAAYLLKHGAQITITGRDAEKLAQAKAQLEEGGGSVHTEAGDVRKSEDVARQVQGHMDRYGKIDFLVNNAAGNFVCPLEHMSENAFRSVMDIVAHGTFLWSKAVFPHMKEAKYGRIVNIGTTYSWGSAAMVAHSGAAKAAVLNLTRSMAVEWGRYGIHLNIVAPGPVKDTEGVRRLMSHPDGEKMLRRVVPSGRLAEGWEIAAAVVFLLSPLADYITGAALPVDGGMCLNVPGLYPAGMPMPEFKPRD